MPVRGGQVQDAAAAAVGALHLPLFRVSQANQLGLWHERDLSQLSAPGRGTAQLLLVSHLLGRAWHGPVGVDHDPGFAGLTHIAIQPADSNWTDIVLVSLWFYLADWKHGVKGA